MQSVYTITMKRIIFYSILLFCLPLSLLADNASNVRVRQRNKDIIITYDLSKLSNVQVWITSDKTPDFVLLNAVEGAVGKRVRSGQDLEIVWHPLEESEDFIADNVRFKVEALGSYEQYALPKTSRKTAMGGKTNMETFILLNGAFAFTKDMSYGLMLGQTYSGIGWYISGRSNFSFQSATDGLTCDKTGYIETEDAIPFYSGRKQVSVLAANAGIVLDFIELGGASPRNRFNTFGIYAGAGYGWRRLLWETMDGKWIEYGPTSRTGVSVNAGVMGSVYGLTLKAGMNMIQFKHLEIEVGIGWMF